MGCSLPTSSDFPCFTCLSELEVLQNSLEGSEIIRISWGPQVVLKANKNGDRKVEVLQKKTLPSMPSITVIESDGVFVSPTLLEHEILIVWFERKKVGNILVWKFLHLHLQEAMISQCSYMCHIPVRSHASSHHV